MGLDCGPRFVSSKLVLFGRFLIGDGSRDDQDQRQIDVYSGRGVLIESREGPIWLVGASSEHHVRLSLVQRFSQPEPNPILLGYLSI